MKNGYICVYDSGIGGLTTLSEIIKLLPNEKYLYVADDKNCPYGNKPQEEIQKLVYNNIKQVLKQYKIKMLMFACNTVTSCCVAQIRAQYGFSVVGIEPAVMPAIKDSDSKEILVILTNATKSQEKYKRLVERADGKVFSLGLNDLARDIENGLIKNKNININKYVKLINKFRLNKNIDSLVLGCTHYVYLKKELKSKLNINVYDGNFGVAKRVKELLNKNDNLLDKGKGEVKIHLTSKDNCKKNEYKRLLTSLKAKE